MVRKEDKAALEQTLSKYLSTEEVKQAVESASLRVLKEARIDFLIFQVRDDDIKNISGYLEKAIEIVIENGFMVHILSSLVMATVGIPPCIEKNAKVDSDKCEELAMKLLQILGNDVKVVYGSKLGLYGNLGSSTYMSYGAVLPDFAMDIKMLGNLSFGVVKMSQ